MPLRPANESPYQCFLCTFVGSEPAGLFNHIEREHSRSNYFWCKWCGKAYSGLDQYMEHLENEVCSDVFEHPCGFEGCTFSDAHPSEFISHLRTAHKGKPLMPCAYCRRLFTLPPCLISHIQNDCCNRPTSSSPSQNFPKPSNKTLQRSSNREESAVSSSTSKTTSSKSTPTENKPTRGPGRPKKNSNPKDKAWNPFGLNKDFIAANDSDSTASTLSDSSKAVRGRRTGPKKKQADSCHSQNSSKKQKVDNPDPSQNAENSKPGIKFYHTWGEWFYKIRKLKCPDAIEVQLKLEKVKHFFKCMNKTCPFTSHDSMSFALHGLDHHEQKPRCPYCLTDFMYIEKLIKHMVTNHNDRRYQCSGCLYRASQKNHLLHHQEVAHAGEEVDIISCDRPEVGGYKKSDDMLIVEEVREANSYNCRVLGCSFATPYITPFRNHFTEKHNNNNNYFACCYCEFETIKLEQLITHYRKHDYNDHECSYCNFGCESLNDVLTHICINHADRRIQLFSRLSNTNPPVVEDNATKVTGSVNSSSVQLLPTSWNSSRIEAQSSSTPSFQQPSGSGLDSNTSEKTDTNEMTSDTYLENTTNDHRTESSLKTLSIVYTVEGGSNPTNCLSPSRHKSSSKVTPESPLSDNSTSKHSKGDKSSDSNLFTCSVCLKTYTYEKSFKKHVMTCVGDNSSEVSHNSSLSDAKTSPLTRNSTPVKLTQPGQIVTAQKTVLPNKQCPTSCKFVCVFCEQGFETEIEITKHLYVELEYKKHSCKYCTFDHYEENEVKKHSRINHKTLVPHVEVVLKQTYEDWIDGYVNMQVNENPGKAFLNLVQSASDRTDDKQCKLCKEILPSISVLKIHLFNHVRYKPHHCSSCEETFTTSDEASEHCRTGHPTKKRNIIIIMKKITKIEQWAEEMLKVQHKAQEERPGNITPSSPSASTCSPVSRASQNLQESPLLKRRRFPVLDVSEDSIAGSSKNVVGVAERLVSTQGLSRSSNDSTGTSKHNTRPIDIIEEGNLGIMSSPNRESVDEDQKVDNMCDYSDQKSLDNPIGDSKDDSDFELPDLDLPLSVCSSVPDEGIRRSENSELITNKRYCDDVQTEMADDVETKVTDVVETKITDDVQAEITDVETELTDNFETELIDDVETGRTDIVETKVINDDDDDVETKMINDGGVETNMADDDDDVVETKMTGTDQESSNDSYANITKTPICKQSARKTFPTARKSTVPTLPVVERISPKQTARKCMSFAGSLIVEKPAGVRRPLFKATARKSTSKPSRCLITNSRAPSSRPYSDSVYIMAKNENVKIYSSNFPRLFPGCKVKLVEFRSTF